ncbi:hypothetical protein [Syntrophothermus lipocalidus]|uniref:Uncharacterized protein n=1 Tax=Syntrophothermus lipocalidus (strain DSM 12680 / TGB-C1) TaxID=643648 RepID=D7CJ11_SYNLT|nr:hypothetical protein [Syntrophothermus lipocalidus]ADI02889.1 hypothetical protein Slip_2146 [Syntrophothermus lipocalidus DSM 12680]HOV42363.1 hypothetical protein [Syntrophothermus lipocalidus]
MHRYFLPVIILVVLSLAALAGCGSPKQAVQENETKSTSQPRETSNVSWPEWSGPQSLGPGGTLPELWHVDFVHFPKPGSAHCYKIGIDSEGNWGDTYNEKGKLTDQELAAVKSALAKVNWNLVPQWSTKDYVAYTATPKSWPFPSDENPYFQVMIWLGQTYNSPPYDGRAVVADLKAPCPPEIKEIIDILKPLQEKYEPQIH